MTIDSIDYNYDFYSIYSTSPKNKTGILFYDSSAYMTPKPLGCSRYTSTLDNETSYYDQLSQYRFPNSKQNSHLSRSEQTSGSSKGSYSPSRADSPTTPTCTTPKIAQQPFSPTRSLRKLPHRRSTAVSIPESSNDSIFSDGINGVLSFNNQFQNSRKSSLTQVDQLNTMSKDSSNTTSGELSDIFQELEFKTNNAPNKEVTFLTNPVIDLDVAAKPLKPRLGVGISFRRHSSISEMNPGIILEDQELDDDACLDFDDDSDDKKRVKIKERSYSEETIDLIDFLRESVSDRAMSIAEDYNPFDHIHLNNTLWIQSTIYNTNSR